MEQTPPSLTTIKPTATRSPSLPRTSKRSTINLANLRLVPLSTKYLPSTTSPTTASSTATTTTTAYLSPSNDPMLTPSPTFSRQHPSYLLQGRSAPPTPGILSRTSTRRHLAPSAGLSRRSPLYDEDEAEGDSTPTFSPTSKRDYTPYNYTGSTPQPSSAERAAMHSGHIPKAKSEAALLARPPHKQYRQQGRLAGQGVPITVSGRLDNASRTYTKRSRTGTSTALAEEEDDWFLRTRSATQALVQESKGQSYLNSSRNVSSTALGSMHFDNTTSDEEEARGQDEDGMDDNYEELAALSASQPPRLLRSSATSGVNSPNAARKSSHWGSRYGSRSASRRTSRRGSVVSMRTPLAGPGANLQESSLDGYFDEDGGAPPMQLEPDFVDGDVDEEAEEREVSRLTDDRSFGLGGIVDTIMNMKLFKVDESADETEGEQESDAERGAGQRLEVEGRRKGNERQTVPPPPQDQKVADQGNAGWQDAAWLLSVATKALF